MSICFPVCVWSAQLLGKNSEATFSYYVGIIVSSLAVLFATWYSPQQRSIGYPVGSTFNTIAIGVMRLNGLLGSNKLKLGQNAVMLATWSTHSCPVWCTYFLQKCNFTLVQICSPATLAIGV